MLVGSGTAPFKNIAELITYGNANPGKEGNMREHASVEQLLVLANIESMNAEFIHMGLAQGDRLKRLNVIAIRQIKALMAAGTRVLDDKSGKRNV